MSSSAEAKAKKKRKKTRNLFNAPKVTQVKEAEGTKLAARTPAAVGECAVNRLYAKIRIAEIDLSEGAGTWKVDHREGRIVLTRGLGEVLLISRCSGSGKDWSVEYDEPIELL